MSCRKRIALGTCVLVIGIGATIARLLFDELIASTTNTPTQAQPTSLNTMLPEVTMIYPPLI
jgi:hypothetical protein